MTTFDNREKGFENKFAHDEELAFRVKARAHKLLGLWAAGKLGKSGPEAEAYAKALILADFEHSGADNISERVAKDFARENVQVNEKDIRLHMQQCEQEARAQLAGQG